MPRTYRAQPHMRMKEIDPVTGLLKDKLIPAKYSEDWTRFRRFHYQSLCPPPAAI
jgi:hypothetical protein